MFVVVVNFIRVLQHLVDWSKAMIPQIAKIHKHYPDWVNKPVDRPLRLFQSDWIEMLTKTPWWVVPLFWIPAIYAIGLNAAFEANSQKLTTVSVFSDRTFSVSKLYHCFSSQCN